MIWKTSDGKRTWWTVRGPDGLSTPENIIPPVTFLSKEAAYRFLGEWFIKEADKMKGE